MQHLCFERWLAAVVVIATLLCGCQDVPLLDGDPPDLGIRFVDGALAADLEDQLATDSAVDAGTDTLANAATATDAGVDVTTDTTTDIETTTAVPISLAAAKAAFAAATTPCFGGNVHVPLVDGVDVMAFFPGCGAGPGSQSPARAAWLNHDCQASVVLVWDPNGCGSDQLSSVGLVARGAELVNGELILPDDATVADIDVFNATTGGQFQEELFGVPDVLNPTPFDIAQSVITAKQVLIDLAFPPAVP